jgi:UDP-glucose 4-epimerase
MRARSLVAGGAGFIGSHLVAGLVARGDDCVVFDNFSTGHREAITPGARVVEGDLADEQAVDALLRDGQFDTVFHLADLSLVGDSMRAPLHYLTVNTGNAGRLIAASVRYGVKRFVFSSTANLFGAAKGGAIDEDAEIAPGSPYGESKWVIEGMLGWADKLHGLRSACLRFFNAAGADPTGFLGEDHTPETHLIPLAIDAALGRRPPLTLFGTDYATADGTCIRDYVHVNDLVTAHLAALERLDHGSVRYNIGLGRGHSVREVIEAVARIGGRPVPHVLAERRPGDPAILIADSRRILAETNWRPDFLSLDNIVGTALAWRLAHPGGFGG